MSMNAQGRPSRPANDGHASPDVVHTTSGHRGLHHEEALIFEQNSVGKSGVDLPAFDDTAPLQLGGMAPRGETGLPGLSEPQVVRHYTRLSQQNYAIDTGFYPLGSCTMKHNPRLNEAAARLPGFADIHPLQPVSTVPGAVELMAQLGDWLLSLTGMQGVALSPGAGAHGELCGMMAIRAALDARGDGIAAGRNRVLVPDSAHGTNPATAAALGFTVDSVPGDARGRIDLDAFRSKLGDDVAAIMLTNPNTCGLFENDIIAIAEAIHEVGGLFYCDGANFNAIVGRVRPGDLGIDAMHINLHKTFSTPHGGGGPGSGPVVFSKAVAPFAPRPMIVREGTETRLVEHDGDPGATGQSFGRLKAYHGQMGMFVRALAYMLSHGADGLRQVADDAVLNANYVMACLSDVMPPSFPGPCMHEALFDDGFLRNSGATTLDLAKALLDEGFHPMTMYFPLVVHGAMLIEPTETESRETLDGFIATMRALAEKAQQGEADALTGAPHLTPRRRLDETRAARQPKLRWLPPPPTDLADAAE